MILKIGEKVGLLTVLEIRKENKEDAIKARKEAEEKYFKIFYLRRKINGKEKCKN